MEEGGREVALRGACQITQALSPSLCTCTLVCVSLCVVVNCSDPGIPANSIRQSKIEHGNFTFGTVVFYDCNPGYYLFGSPVLTCQPTGQWDKPLPECIGEPGADNQQPSAVRSFKNASLFLLSPCLKLWTVVTPALPLMVC